MAVNPREYLRAKAKALKTEMTALFYAYKDPHIPVLPKIIIVFTLGYALSPIDLIPDFIPILGQLDDLVIIPALISLSIRVIPREIIDEARKRAEREPFTLRKNWFFALIFILIWAVLLAAIAAGIVRLIRRAGGF
jgi:uncharacterized membrane protein YkvA (DUF1232 family)